MAIQEQIDHANRSETITVAEFSLLTRFQPQHGLSKNQTGRDSWRRSS